MLVMVSALLWLFLTVTMPAGLFFPIASFPNERLDGVAVTAVTPVPLSATICGLLPALSRTLNVPLRVPRAVGLKLTEIVQLLAPLSVAGQLLVCEKSDGVELMLVIEMALL
jgi:hypothetical protein